MDSKPPSPSSPFRARLTSVLRELERAVREAADRDWDAACRKRANDIALNLSEVCRSEGLHEIAGITRSLGGLMRLTPEQIRPIETSLREKIDELLDALQTASQRFMTGSA